LCWANASKQFFTPTPGETADLETAADGRTRLTSIRIDDHIIGGCSASRPEPVMGEIKPDEFFSNGRTSEVCRKTSQRV